MESSSATCRAGGAPSGPSVARLLGAGLVLVGLLASAVETDAGQAQANFTVSVSLLPAHAGACSIAVGATAIRVACAPASVALHKPPAPPLAPLQRSTGAARDGAFLEVIHPQQELMPFDVLTPKDEERTRDQQEQEQRESLLSRLFAPAARVQVPTQHGEYSSRTVALGGFEYVEMTVSW